MSNTQEILVPRMNPNDDHAVLVRWHVESGARVREGSSLATLETTKATFDVEAPHDGFVFFDVEPKTMVDVGSRLAWLSERNERPQDGQSPERASPQTATDADTAEKRFTRKALKLARQHGLRLEDFSSIGAERIEASDVERVLQERTATSVGTTRAPNSSAREDKGAGYGVARPPSDDSVVPLEQSPAKMIEIQALSEVYRSAIPSTVALSICGETLDSTLQKLGSAAGPVTALELVIHQAARLLREFPDLNGYYADGRAWRYPEAEIGFAINAGMSLRVPVVHRAAELSLVEIARQVRDLSLRYLRGELQLPDLSGGTFTVTDLSGRGIEHFVPVINLRQAAILGICAPRAGTRHRELVLTFDHRMSDGMRAATFLGELRERLENAVPE